MSTVSGPLGVFDYNQYRHLTHFNEAVMILNGRMPPPRTAVFYPAHACRKNSRWCEPREFDGQVYSYLEPQRMMALLASLRAVGVMGVELCGGNDPALYPELAEVLPVASADGLAIGMLTMGAYCTGALAEALVSSARYVRVALGGAHAASHQERSQVSFDAVCAHVRELADLRNERHSALRISLRIAVDNRNIAEVGDCAELALRLGADSLQFKPVRLGPHALASAQSEEAVQALQALRQRYPGMPVTGGLDRLHVSRQCWLTPLQLMLDANGDVYLCCNFTHEDTAEPLGNVFEQPLHDIWYGETHWDALRTPQPHACAAEECRFLRSSAAPGELLGANDAYFGFE